ncbi:S8 family peptidase [Hymenobacter cavernae]|uniref:Peptidase S8 n=1 Tax=Hymenobacter cavernae TaxID=2044852 RepID=A0ABQ1UI88_9BACT|nr:S8 family peptidase [Hymenobacter cavernae]GGF19528.1 peptidase S8 [Hymenobacter cavernae]
MHFSVRPGFAFLLASLLQSATGFAQTPAPAPTPADAQSQQWFHLDFQKDAAVGISTQRTYQELLKNRKPTPVIVAVIDGGVDTAHQDLRRVMWKNPKEIAGNGQDDDHNGFVDDVYGWNFLGAKDGRNVDIDTYEDTRLMAKLQPLYEGKTRTSVPTAKREEFDLYTQVKKTYQEKLDENTKQAQQIGQLYEQTEQVVTQVKQALNVQRLDTATLHHPPTSNPALLEVSQQLYQGITTMGFADAESVVAEMKKAAEHGKTGLDYSLNLKYNPREIIGDNPENTKDRAYGNKDVTGPDPEHGTHVAGIIAADRDNNLGVQGVAGSVRIMAVRAVPNGDEHDKDIANAIRYAVDNGAQIINMSFGKYYSPQRPAVEEAIRYAGTKGVLLVHSAGNENKDLDVETQYPSPRFLDGKTIPNMITVGASARQDDEKLAAEFSNYGKRTVDVFAPGVNIYSTLPGNKYGNESGTSMAGPVVSGIAAVLKSYFPKLTPVDLKRIIQQSAVPYHTQVFKPGTQTKVPFDQLSNTGGVVNLYRAVQLAQQQP